MGKPSFVPPEYLKSAFSCPHCQIYSNHVWGQLDSKIDNRYIRLNDYMVSRCIHCLNFILWKDGVQIYPDISQAPLPNPDLPEEIINYFHEARSIINHSPRAAAALLRLCIQKLCTHLGESGKNIDKDIESFIKVGLNPKIQKNLNAVRVTGNEAVQPGRIDTRDDYMTAIQIFQLINIIVNAMISQPKLLEDLNEKVAEAKKQKIEKPNKEDSVKK